MAQKMSLSFAPFFIIRSKAFKLFKWELLNLSSIILLFITSGHGVRNHHEATHVDDPSKPKGHQGPPKDPRG